MPRLCERLAQPPKQSNSFPASTGQDSCRRAVKIVDTDHRCQRGLDCGPGRRARLHSCEPCFPHNVHFSEVGNIAQLDRDRQQTGAPGWANAAREPRLTGLSGARMR